MHFHIPKPLHGWREFAGEVGIIVVGVLIALSAEQVVERIRGQHELRQSDRAMELELGESVGQAVIRVEASPCVEQRLDRLAAVVDEASATRRLPPVPRVRPSQYFTWPSGTYQSMIGSGVANRQPRDRLEALSGIYDFIADLNDEQRRELDVWTRVFAIVGPGRSFDAEDAREARSAIADARSLDRIIDLRSLRIIQLLHSYGIQVDRESVEKYTHDQGLAERPPHCNPWGGSEAHYGEAPRKNIIANATAVPVTRVGR